MIKIIQPKNIISLLLMTFSFSCFSNVFVGYELLEMSEANFKNYAFEIGHRSSDQEFRFVALDVQLTEEHLSGKYAAIVEGEGIEGELKGLELYYNSYFSEGWYYMINFGYLEMNFREVDSDIWYRNSSLMAGTGIGYKWQNLLGIKGLYLNPHFPIRFLFNPIEEYSFTNATVQTLEAAINVWLFLGYSF